MEWAQLCMELRTKWSILMYSCLRCSFEIWMFIWRMFCRNWPNWSIEQKACMNWSNYSSLLSNSEPFLAWGWLTMVSMEPKKALLAADQKATLPSQVHTFENIQNLCFPTQFTICSSATTDAFSTNLNFFTMLRFSGNPWISFFSMPPQPGSDDPFSN